MLRNLWLLKFVLSNSCDKFFAEFNRQTSELFSFISDQFEVNRYLFSVGINTFETSAYFKTAFPQKCIYFQAHTTGSSLNSADKPQSSLVFRTASLRSIVTLQLAAQNAGQI